MKNSIFTVLAALVLYPAGAQPVTPQDRRRAAAGAAKTCIDFLGAPRLFSEGIGTLHKK